MHKAVPVHAALTSLARRLAVAAGALTALVSLLHDAPVRIACLRGALAFAAALLVARWARLALERSLQHDHEAASSAPSEP